MGSQALEVGMDVEVIQSPLVGAEQEVQLKPLGELRMCLLELS
jgi:hypothetical protein